MGTLVALCQGTKERETMRRQLVDQLLALTPLTPYQMFTTTGQAIRQLMTLHHYLLPSTGAALGKPGTLESLAPLKAWHH